MDYITVSEEYFTTMAAQNTIKNFIKSAIFYSIKKYTNNTKFFWSLLKN